MLTLETERLVLREMTVKDAPFMLTLLNSQGFLDNIGDRGVRTLAQAENHLIEGPLNSYQEHGYGMYCIELRQSGEPVGVAGLVNREQLPGIDLGYALLPDYLGKGYAVEACRAVLAHAKTLAIGLLLAIVNEGNGPSRALLEKLGFVCDGPIPWGEDGEVLLYAIRL
ncbi:GNAT family N-acetyltransferase [Shewanella insulae]|uniref:GNAT family N-acetyltransferase n=1 Tax=Shewanella insulae TaxID=2681496 RepID=UPI001EFE40AD|nr:GNAT family N-acetyltransferase [Shewanella insulae]MCG9755501.1 GNAT family N-acetyltransferase [Shewanella insulae]